MGQTLSITKKTMKKKNSSPKQKIMKVAKIKKVKKVK